MLETRHVQNEVLSVAEPRLTFKWDSRAPECDILENDDGALVCGERFAFGSMFSV